MAKEPDDNFFDRADAIINIANSQMSDATAGEVSASSMYAVARFNAFLSSTGHTNGIEMQSAKTETIAYFVSQFRAMLEENLDEFIHHLNNQSK
ncbi:MAG: DUF3144 domain-containing protein [Brucellaceae bacterium]|nr:DUF3144 domain-containing protein [Brucellaceae bacterium]